MYTSILLLVAAFTLGPLMFWFASTYKITIKKHKKKSRKKLPKLYR